MVGKQKALVAGSWTSCAELTSWGTVGARRVPRRFETGEAQAWARGDVSRVLWAFLVGLVRGRFNTEGALSCWAQLGASVLERAEACRDVQGKYKAAGPRSCPTFLGGSCRHPGSDCTCSLRLSPAPVIQTGSHSRRPGLDVASSRDATDALVGDGSLQFTAGLAHKAGIGVSFFIAFSSSCMSSRATPVPQTHNSTRPVTRRAAPKHAARGLAFPPTAEASAVCRPLVTARQDAALYVFRRLTCSCSQVAPLPANLQSAPAAPTS